MINNHPIIPSTELVEKWHDAWIDAKVKHNGLMDFIATQAAQWGADQELEACCEWFNQSTVGMADLLREYRRPKPPSLKEQAIAALNEIEDHMLGPTNQEKLIRRALETL